MHGDTDGARLIRDRAGDGLANPPGRVGRKFESLGVVKLIHRLDQAEVALLDQVEELHAAPHIALCNADDQAQICLRQPLLSDRIVFTDADGKVNFFLTAQQGNAADLFEIDLDRIVHCYIFVIDPNGKVGIRCLWHIRRVKRNHIQGSVSEIVDNFNILAFNRVVELVQLLHVHIHFYDGRINLMRRQAAACFAFIQQAFDRLLFLRVFHIHTILSCAFEAKALRLQTAPYTLCILRFPCQAAYGESLFF